MNKFRIKFVPQDTKVSFKKSRGFVMFNLYIKNRKIEKDMYVFLKRALESVPNIKIDEEEQKLQKANKQYYYILTTKNGIIQFEINYGRKYLVDNKNPPTISLQTDPYIPTPEFLSEIKEVVKLLIGKTGFKIYFWDAARFLTVDELYGREGPVKKEMK